MYGLTFVSMFYVQQEVYYTFSFQKCVTYKTTISSEESDFPQVYRVSDIMVHATNK